MPDQLRARGETIETRVAAPEEMWGLLTAKLHEEMAELIEALEADAENQIIEEMADVREVFEALEKQPSSGLAVIGLEARMRQFKKREEKGGFTNIVMRLDESEPKMLFCPKCNLQHIDKGVYATRVHRSHLCAGCGHVWRPFDKATVGVEALPDSGGVAQKSSSNVEAAAAVAAPSAQALSTGAGKPVDGGSSPPPVNNSNEDDQA